MTLLANFSIDILSGRLKPKARKWRFTLIVAVILFLLIPYPISRVLGDNTFSLIIYCLIVGLAIFSAVVYKYFVERYEVIGAVVFNSETIKVKIANEINLIELKNINEIGFEFSAYDDQPFKYGPKLRTENGNKNYLTILTNKATYRYELFLESSKMLRALENYLDYYSGNGIKISILNI